MSKIDTGGMVYPSTTKEPKESETAIWNETVYENGITRRDWLAGLAMQGLLSKPSLLANKGEMLNDEVLAVAAYQCAAALIAEGRKGGE